MADLPNEGDIEILVKDKGSSNIARVNVEQRLFTSDLTYLHQKVHDGDLFIVSDYVLVSSAFRVIYIYTGSKTVHLFWIVGATGTDAELYINESPTVTANGTQLTVYNMNRSSSNTALTAFYHTPTVTANGTEIFRGRVAPNYTASIFGSGGDGVEFILKANTRYLFRPYGQGSTKLNTNLIFYEV